MLAAKPANPGDLSSPVSGIDPIGRFQRVVPGRGERACRSALAGTRGARAGNGRRYASTRGGLSGLRRGLLRGLSGDRARLRRVRRPGPGSQVRRADRPVRRGSAGRADCLGWQSPVRNPPHDLKVRTRVPLLLLSTRHGPRTGHAWAVNVARQLGRHGRLVTYVGWGHGAYQRNDCTIAIVDRYLVDLTLPNPGARCPAS